MRRLLRLCVPMLPMLVLVAAPAAAQQLEFRAARIEGVGWQASDVRIAASADGSAEVRVARVHAAALPAGLQSLDDLRLRCAELQRRQDRYGCARAEIAAATPSAGTLKLSGAVDYRDGGHWSFDVQRLAAQLTYAHDSGRYAAEALRVEGNGRLRQRGSRLQLDAELRLPSGQAYVEPVYNDFAAQPLKLRLRGALDLARSELRIESAVLQQTSVGEARIEGTLNWREQLVGAWRLDLPEVQLGTVLSTYVQPFMAGTRLDRLEASGRASARLDMEGGTLRSLQLQLDGSDLDLPRLGVSLQSLSGALHWSHEGLAAPSQLQWTAARVEKLALGGATLHLRAGGRDLQLEAPLRIPVAGGALRIERFKLTHAGQPDMGAAFAAGIEPIDLAALCRDLGWPVFAGQLSGRIPGLTLKDREISLDGALHARAFDGEITVEGLRIIEPFGVLPRIAADLRLRHLDLEAVTGAFSFGRIEGRLHGDVEGLRLIGWEPVAMRARLYTPPGDDSRHRISQRAIDNISSIGGGPTGILSRGILRFFEDFAYKRIGWSCVLADGVCRMDGIKPADTGDGYVLVEGKLLPRIDVIGYTRRVSWRTFLRQLESAREADKVEVR